MSGFAKLVSLVVLLMIVIGVGFAAYTMLSSFGFFQSGGEIPIELREDQNGLSVVWNSKREDIEEIIVENKDTGAVSTVDEQGSSVGISRSETYVISATLVDQYGGTYDEEVARVRNGTIEEL